VRKTSRTKRAVGSQKASTPERELAFLRKIEKESHQSRGRFWEREVLTAVYGVWSRRGWWTGKLYAAQLAKLCNVKPKPGTHAIRTIIDCTSPRTDPKRRSRWALALRLAADRNLKPEELGEFFAEEGGIAGRANEFEARSRAAKEKKARQSKAARHR